MHIDKIYLILYYTCMFYDILQLHDKIYFIDVRLLFCYITINSSKFI